MDEESSDSCSENELLEPWQVTDNLVNGCVQYFVPGTVLFNCHILMFGK